MIRAYVSEGFASLAVGISLIMNPDAEQPRIYRLVALDDGHISYEWEPVERNTEIRPTLCLGHAEAIALMTALNAHFSGVDDQRALRKDYDDERKRVDDLTGVLSGVLKTLAETQR